LDYISKALETELTSNKINIYCYNTHNYLGVTVCMSIDVMSSK